MVEAVKRDDGYQWESMDKILRNPSQRDAYMRAISDLMKQAQDKMDTLRALMGEDQNKAA